MQESESKSNGPKKSRNRAVEASKDQQSNSTNPSAPANPLTLQVRNWGIVDFSKILKIRYKPD